MFFKEMVDCVSCKFWDYGNWCELIKIVNNVFLFNEYLL